MRMFDFSNFLEHRSNCNLYMSAYPYLPKFSDLKFISDQIKPVNKIKHINKCYFETRKRIFKSEKFLKASPLTTIAHSFSTF